MEQWTKNSQAQAEVEAFILDESYVSLRRPPRTKVEAQQIAAQAYEFVWQRIALGELAA